MAENKSTVLIDELHSYGVGRLRCIAEIIPSAFSSAYCLDIGCGAGIWNTRMRGLAEKKGYTYVGVNIAKDQLQSDMEQIRNSKQGDGTYLLGDACALPFARRFKLVIALEVIEHLDDQEKLLAEIDGILLEDGYLMISTPNKFSMEGITGKMKGVLTGRRWNAWDPEHKHVFASPEFLSLVSKRLSIDKVCGYYILPALPATLGINKMNSLLRTFHQPLNGLCFQTIVLLRKVNYGRK